MARGRVENLAVVKGELPEPKKKEEPKKAEKAKRKTLVDLDHASRLEDISCSILTEGVVTFHSTTNFHQIFHQRPLTALPSQSDLQKAAITLKELLQD